MGVLEQVVQNAAEQGWVPIEARRVGVALHRDETRGMPSPKALDGPLRERIAVDLLQVELEVSRDRSSACDVQARHRKNVADDRLKLGQVDPHLRYRSPRRLGEGFSRDVERHAEPRQRSTELVRDLQKGCELFTQPTPTPSYAHSPARAVT